MGGSSAKAAKIAAINQFRRERANILTCLINFGQKFIRIAGDPRLPHSFAEADGVLPINVKKPGLSLRSPAKFSSPSRPCAGQPNRWVVLTVSGHQVLQLAS
jgi:hypothetical protein